VRLGVISDTHGMLRPEVFEIFKAVDHILHGGDVGGAISWSSSAPSPR